MEVVELKVHLHCKVCQNTIRKKLCTVKGVTCVEMDVILNKITVPGYVDRKIIIKTVRKTGRRAELWSSSTPAPPSRRRDVKPRGGGGGSRFGCIIIPRCGF